MRKWRRHIGNLLRRTVLLALEDADRVDTGTQLLLSLRYRELRDRGGPLPPFRDVGFRCFSQNREDGILLYIFSLIGTTNRQAVEICAGDGIECNTSNLIVNHGWNALLVDGDEERVRRGREFYARRRETRVWPPTFVCTWVTAENVDSILTNNGVTGEIDLLSLDMDGIDYWVWKAISVISPRVVVFEYQDIWGPDRAVTVPYDPHFRARFTPQGPDYAGASLLAFVTLAAEKGYRFVGCEPLGFNGFFVRSGVGEDVLPSADLRSCFDHPKVREGLATRLARVQDLEWIEV